MKIRKLENPPGRLSGQRLVIKSFPDREAGHDFLNRQYDNDWQEYTGDLKPGKYAFAGGMWHNVKKLDPSVLAHI